MDQPHAGALGLNLADVNDTLSTAWGGAYVNELIDRGRVKHVYVQGDAQFRARPEDLNDWFVRGATGTMAPFSSFSNTSWVVGPSRLERYNGLSSFEIQASPPPASPPAWRCRRWRPWPTSCRREPALEWTGLSYEERLSWGAGADASMAFR